jgi:hypothetical protein
LNFIDRREFCDWCDEFEFRGSSKHPDQLLNEGLAALRCHVTVFCAGTADCNVWTAAAVSGLV